MKVFEYLIGGFLFFFTSEHLHLCLLNPVLVLVLLMLLANTLHIAIKWRSSHKIGKEPIYSSCQL
jgi:hypothetical protein